MKKILLPLLGVSAIVLAMTLNLSYAADNYGILKNTLSFHITAQASTSGGSSNSGSNSGSGSDMGSKPKCKQQISIETDKEMQGKACPYGSLYSYYNKTSKVYSCITGSGTCKSGAVISGNTCSYKYTQKETEEAQKAIDRQTGKSC